MAAVSKSEHAAAECGHLSHGYENRDELPVGKNPEWHIEILRELPQFLISAALNPDLSTFKSKPSMM